MSKTTLITGGTGLMAVNWAAIAPNRQQLFLLQHKRSLELCGVQSCHFNLENKVAIAEALRKINPDFVVHAAGMTNIEQCEENQELAYFTNTTLAANIAEVCASLNIKLVHISTDHLFDGNVAKRSESESPQPLNQYAKTKAQAEAAVTDLNNEALVIRTNIFGWGTSYRISFSDFIIENLRARKTITLFEDVYFSPILVAHLARIVGDLLESNATGIVNIASSERISKFDFGILLAESFGLDASYICRGSLEDNPALVTRPKDMSLSTRKLSSILGRSAPSIKDGLLELKRQEELGTKEELRAL